ncbi:MAG TPA: hypothetical protein VHZ54_00320 [Solirubrobacterales bacterium]|nr:hypothetical protein [Solirubrobacterales bacterium]
MRLAAITFRRRLLLGVLLAFSLVLATSTSASALSFGLNWDGNNHPQAELLDSVQASGASVYHVPLAYIGPGGDWSGNDALVEEAWRRGLTILPTLEGPTNRFLLVSDPEWGAWGEWVEEVVARYGVGGSFWEGKANPTPITAWEVWNEPNLPDNNPVLSEAQCAEVGQTWIAEAGTCVQPQGYGVFLAYSAERMQAAARATAGAETDVLFGGLNSQVGESPEAFLGKARLYGGLSPDVTGIAFHPYAFVGGVAGMAEDLTALRRDLDTLLESGDKSIWITEVGWPVDGTVPVGGTVSEDDQATLLGEACDWIKANAAADDIQLVTWYNVRDFDVAAWDGRDGLQREDGSYYPSWYAFQEQTGAEPSGSMWSAFGLADGRLLTFSTSEGLRETGLAIMSGTSPAVVTTSPRGALVAFQAPSGHLWIYTTGGGADDTGLVMQPGTSPTIATDPSGGDIVTFQSSTGEIWHYSTVTGTAVGTGMTLTDYATPNPDPPPGVALVP